ncbi:Vegetative incompatibility protein HET-E-1 [Leucoagaricus sp. SymC.cos]|nr:Vegetative incompatibility protein HET-E-1 [Leucoagaricus sp. SymC.cos]
MPESEGLFRGKGKSTVLLSSQKTPNPRIACPAFFKNAASLLCCWRTAGMVDENTQNAKFAGDDAFQKTGILGSTKNNVQDPEIVASSSNAHSSDGQRIAIDDRLRAQNIHVGNTSVHNIRMDDGGTTKTSPEHPSPLPSVMNDSSKCSSSVMIQNARIDKTSVVDRRDDSADRGTSGPAGETTPDIKVDSSEHNLSPGSHLRRQGFFANANNFQVSGSYWQMIDNSGQNVYMGNSVMKDLAGQSIPGVEHDSSERDPPPQCHPGTRLDICGQAQSWFHNTDRNEKILWIHGPAGIGKSAIMQTLAQEEHKSSSSILGATIFFSKLRQRNNPKRLLNTIAYQFATRYKPYRQYVTDILTDDPKIIEKSMKEQFNWFIVRPFAEQNVLRGYRETLLIILDGLDEVEGIEAQRQLVSLIVHFTFDHPTSPLIWAIASRPEPDIMQAFNSLTQVPPSYLEIGMQIDSDQGRADMELFLRKRFDEIRVRYRAPSDWPSEVDFLKVAKAASGHFIFGEAATRFIDDEDYANPVSQLEVVVVAIESTTSNTLELNPLALLDNLYSQILLAVHPRTRHITTRLLALSFTRFNRNAFGALRKLHSVLRIPSPDKVEYGTKLEPFHKSFSDYILSSTRSGQFHATHPEKIAVAGAVRVLCESRDPIDSTTKASMIKLSWACTDQNSTELQTQLFECSLLAVVDYTDAAMQCEDDVARTSEQLAAFFRDVDYADFSNLPKHTVGYWFKDTGSIRRTLPVLEGWGLARPITISSIQLNRVRTDRAADVGGLVHVGKPTETPRFFKNPKQNPWGEQKTPFSQFPNWQQQLQEHLQAIKELELPARVYLIGKGIIASTQISYHTTYVLSAVTYNTGLSMLNFSIAQHPIEKDAEIN